MTNGSKIKLLIFIPTLQCGGTEKFVSLFCDHIDTEKFSVCLVVLDNAAPFYQLKNAQVHLVDLKESRVRYSLFKIRKTIKVYQPDIVFSCANHLNLYFAIFRNWFPREIKFLARESSIVSINNQRSTMPWLYNRLLKKYFRRFDFIVCQSAYMQQDLIQHYHIRENKTQVIYNATEERIPQQLPGNDNKVYKFVTVSRLSEEKGIERLIHAVGLLMLPFRYYIIGDGDKRESLQNLINELELQDKVFLTGKKEDPFAGMEDADLFLMGSYYEGFPNVLLEAGACGIPVVAFHAPGGIGEIITEGENGLLVEDNDLIGFASAINKAIALNFDRNKIIETTQKRFSIRAMMKKLEDLLLQL
ncbi:MAG TPA: glycosyltransferase [Ferruginibacter sp.]|nr:glycosyltransferase [Ferruginibacter sp.]